MSTAAKKLLHVGISVCVIYIALFLIMFPSSCIAAAQDAVTLCLTSVIPSLFPFLVCSGIFSASGAAKILSRYLSPLMRPLFGVSGCGAVAFLCGIVSGYPVGAACAADLYRSGECTKTEAERICAFCNNSGPLFVISVVGCGFLKNITYGKYLYAAHILAALLTGIIFRLYKPFSAPRIKALPHASIADAKSTARLLGSAFDTAVFTMLKICGFVIFFSVVTATLPKSPATPIIHAFLEITGGLKSICELEIDPYVLLSVISFFTAFSGLSVILQVSSVISPVGLSLSPYILGKLVQGSISAVLIRIMLNVFPPTQSTFTQKSPAAFAAEPLENLFFSFKLLALTLLTAVLLTLLGAFAQKLRHRN